MFFKLNKQQASRGQQRREGQHDSESNNLSPVKFPQIPQLPLLTNVRNIELPELRLVQSKDQRLKSVDPKKKRELEIFENGRASRDLRFREASNKLKVKIAEQSPESRTGTTQTPARARSRNQPAFQISKKQNRSMDTGTMRDVLNRSQANNQEEEYSPIHNHRFKVPDIKNVLLKSRKEEFNENVFDSLSTEIKQTLLTSVQKFVYSKNHDIDRLQMFAKLIINGLYVNKFLRKKENLYTPPRVMLPKDEVD